MLRTVFVSLPYRIRLVMGVLSGMFQRFVSGARNVNAVSDAPHRWCSWSMIQPSDALRTKSAQLVDRYDLRAADSFQLAAALVWCEDAPQGRIFLAADQKLTEAALLSGFDAKQM